MKDASNPKEETLRSTEPQTTRATIWSNRKYRRYGLSLIVVLAIAAGSRVMVFPAGLWVCSHVQGIFDDAFNEGVRNGEDPRIVALALSVQGYAMSNTTSCFLESTARGVTDYPVVRCLMSATNLSEYDWCNGDYEGDRLLSVDANGTKQMEWYKGTFGKLVTRGALTADGQRTGQWTHWTGFTPSNDNRNPDSPDFITVDYDAASPRYRATQGGRLIAEYSCKNGEITDAICNYRVVLPVEPQSTSPLICESQGHRYRYWETECAEYCLSLLPSKRHLLPNGVSGTTPGKLGGYGGPEAVPYWSR